MRNGLIIFGIGLVLGSTLGLGGVWTQVVKPAHEQIKQLELEHGILSSAVEKATDALRHAADELRGEPQPSDVTDATAPAEETQRLARNSRLAERLQQTALELEVQREGVTRTR
jgi:hypothetical protein